MPAREGGSGSGPNKISIPSGAPISANIRKFAGWKCLFWAQLPLPFVVESALGTIEKSPGFQPGVQGSHQAHESWQGRQKTIQYDPYLMKNVAALPSLRDSDSCVDARPRVSTRG